MWAVLGAPCPPGRRGARPPCQPRWLGSARGDRGARAGLSLSRPRRAPVPSCPSRHHPLLVSFMYGLPCDPGGVVGQILGLVCPLLVPQAGLGSVLKELLTRMLVGCRSLPAASLLPAPHLAHCLPQFAQPKTQEGLLSRVRPLVGALHYDLWRLQPWTRSSDPGVPVRKPALGAPCRLKATAWPGSTETSSWPWGQGGREARSVLSHPSRYRKEGAPPSTSRDLWPHSWFCGSLRPERAGTNEWTLAQLRRRGAGRVWGPGGATCPLPWKPCSVPQGRPSVWPTWGRARSPLGPRPQSCCFRCGGQLRPWAGSLRGRPRAPERLLWPRDPNQAVDVGVKGVLGCGAWFAGGRPERRGTSLTGLCLPPAPPVTGPGL